jgi:ABC-type transport system substrate-binding protein
VQFHDGSELTSADVKASLDRIVDPPEGAISPRRSYFQMIKSIEAPDPSTMVIRLHYCSASFLNQLAHSVTITQGTYVKPLSSWRKNVLAAFLSHRRCTRMSRMWPS